MEDIAPEKKRKAKPKIIQLMTGAHGLAGVLYDNGRVFLWNWTKAPNQFEKEPQGEGFWGELKYPEVK